MADMAGGDYLYTFGFNFETSGLDQLLGAIEAFSQRAQAGFGASMALPEGVSSTAASPEGVVPLGTPGQVESATQGIEAGLKAFVASLRATGDLSAEQIKRVSDTIDAQIASIRRGAGRYAQRAEPTGVLYGPQGEVLVHPQEQARLRLMEQGRQAATAKGRAEATVQGPIEQLYPPTKKVEDFEYIVNPANREELNAAIKARARLFQQERLFASLDNAEKQKEISASDENRAAAADETLARRRYAARLKAEELDLTKEGGEYEPVRPREVLNRIEQERQARKDQQFYLAQRDQPYYEPQPGGGERLTSATEQDAALKLAEERDRVTTSLKYYAQKTDEDRESLALEKNAREDDTLAIREHAIRLRKQADEALSQRQAAAVVAAGDKGVSFEELDKLGVPSAQRAGRVQADEEEDRAARKRVRSVLLLGSGTYEADMAEISVNNKELAADIKLAAEKIMEGDVQRTKTVAEGNAAEQTRIAQERTQTQQLLAANTAYIKARAEGAVAAEQTALETKLKEGEARDALKTDPRGGIDLIKLRGISAATDRVDAAESKLAEIETLRAVRAESGFALTQVAERGLNAAIEKEALAHLASAEGQKVLNVETRNRLEQDRQSRQQEGAYLASRRLVHTYGASGQGGTDISQEAALQLMREEDRAAVALSRHAQQTEEDRSKIAQTQNAREDETLAIEEHARRLRQINDRELEQQRRAARQQGAEPPTGQTYVERRGGAAAEREIDTAEIGLNKAKRLRDDLLYQQSVEEATEITRKQNAEMKATVEQTLNADKEYIEARAVAASFARSTAAQEQARTEEILNVDKEYIDATAAAAVSRRTQEYQIAESARKQEQQTGFDFAGAEAKQRVAKQVEEAQVKLAQGKLLENLPAGQRIDLVTGPASAAAEKKILDAQINAQLQEELAARTEYTDAVVKAAANQKLLAARIEAETIDAVRSRATREDPNKDPNAATNLVATGIFKRQAFDEEVKLRVLDQQVKLAQEQAKLGQESVSAQRLVLQKQLQVAQREGAQQAFLQAGFGQSGTRFQRAQAQIDISRSGQLRDPQEYQSLGAFFGQRAMNTFGYLTSGIAFYGLFDQFKQALTEATNVQRELTVLQATFKETDKAGSFQGTKAALLDIASETGRLGSETVNVFRQLYGAFQQNVPAALVATQQSLKFAQVTGLDPKEINDSITAIALSFNTMDVTPFLDQAIKLEQVFGVLPQETIQFAADLAPLAEQMGFSATQLESFGAAAQAVSGKTGGALAEQLGRVFEVFTDPTKITDLLAVFDKQLPGALDAFTSTMAQGNVEGSFEVILKNLDELDRTAPGKAKNIRDALVNVAGGPRQASALSAVLSQPGVAYKALTGEGIDATGALQTRFEEVQKSLSQVFEQIRRGIEQLMQAIISSGLGDALVNIGTELEKIIGTATTFLNLFTKINDLFGGLPGQILAVIAVVKVLSTAMNTVQRLGIAEALLGPTIAGRLPGAGTRPSAAAAAAAERGAQAGAVPGALGGVRTVVGGVGATAAASETAGGIKGAVQAAGGVRGLATSAGLSAAISGIGETIASAAIPIAGTLALIAVTNIVDHVKEINKKATEATAKLDETIATEIQQGVDPKKIIDEAKTHEDEVSPEWSFQLTRQWSVDFTPPSWLGGKPSAASQAMTQIRKANAERQKLELDKIVPAMNQQQRQDFVQALAAAKPGEYDYSKLVQPGGLEDFVKQFAEHPEDPFKNDAVARLIDYARGHLPPEVQKELQGIADSFKTDAEQAARQKLEDTGTLDTDIQTATERLKAGIGSTPEVKAAFDEKIKLLKGTLAKATDPRLRDALQLQIATYQKNYNDAIAGYIKQQEDNFDKLQTAAHGEVPPQQKQQRLLEHAVDPTLDVQTHYNNYVEYIQTQQDDLQKRAGLARTAAEKLKILQEGLPIPEDVRAGAQASGIGTQYQEYAAGLGQNADEFGKTVQEQAKELGVDQQTVVKAILDARIKVLEAIPPSIISNEAQAELKRLKDLRAKLETAPPPETPDPGATATATPEQIWQAAIDANKEKAQKLQGLQDLQSAKLRDPIQTAKDNIEKARIAKDNAAPDSLEFIQALIDEQNAINELADAQAEITQAFYTLAASQTRDPLSKAKIGVDAARAALANAHGDAETMRAQAALNDAINAVNDAQDEIVASLYSLAEAQTRDPVLRAQYALDAAIYVRDHAKGTSDWLKAQAQVEQAIQGVQDAQNEIVQAMYELAQAQTTNPVLAAQYAVDAAQASIDNAHDTATQIRAIAAKVQADRALRQAIYDVANSQLELLEAYANAAGDTVGAAQIALTLARQKLDQVMQSTPDDVKAVRQAKADVAAAERASYDATLTQKQDDIQFALDMKQITQQQAIGMLQSLLAIPTNTLAQQRAIQRQIESLKGQLGQDFQFNLPSILGLPTMYEARRLSQGAGQGLGGYQDNRQISIQVFANTNADPNQIAAAVADVLGPPQTFGIAGRRY